MDIILDENILVFAAKMEDENGVKNRKHARLLFDILDRCDILLCSKELHQKYLSKLDLLTKAGYDNAYSVIRTIVHVRQLGKLRVQDDPPSMDNLDEQKVPRKDLFIIRLAAKTKALVITSDGKLRDKLVAEGLDAKYQFRIMKPEEVRSLSAHP